MVSYKALNTTRVSAINEYLKKECINIFRDLNANDFKNSLEKQVLTYTKGNVERSFERILEGVSKCAPSFFMHKAPTFTSRGFVIT